MSRKDVLDKTKWGHCHVVLKRLKHPGVRYVQALGGITISQLYRICCKHSPSSGVWHRIRRAVHVYTHAMSVPIPILFATAWKKTIQETRGTKADMMFLCLR